MNVRYMIELDLADMLDRVDIDSVPCEIDVLESELALALPEGDLRTELRQRAHLKEELYSRRQ